MSSTIFNLFFFGSDPMKSIHNMSAFTGSYLSSQAVSSQVLSAYKGLTAVFGMGTGGTP
jgi:hypothetical protein